MSEAQQEAQANMTASALSLVPEITEVSPVIEGAEAFQIACQDDYQLVYDMASSAKKYIKGVKGVFKTAKETAYAAHNEVCKAETTLLGPAEEVVSIYRLKMGAWDKEQARIAREAAQKAAEEARKLEEARLAKAAELEAEGHHEEADAVIEAPAPVHVSKTPAKVAGVAKKTTWKAKVTDVQAFLRGVADGSIPMAMVEIKQGALNRQAQMLGEELSYPGTEVYEDHSVAIR